MNQEFWAERALPAAPTPAVVLTGDLVRVADLTAARGALRARLTSAPGTAAGGVDEEDVDRLLLAFEELTSNGLRHGGPPVRVTVTAHPGGWLIDVTDTAVDRPPTPAVDRDPAHGGLGLYLVARLSERHGWSAEAGRKHVWACFRRAAAA